MRFRDDGLGINHEVLRKGGRPGHWGLVGMQERASQIGARLEVWSKPGAGTELELSIPGHIAYGMEGKGDAGDRTEDRKRA
jgi:signal transduction histidine kinase